MNEPATQLELEKLRSVDELAQLKQRLSAQQDPSKPVIIVCHGTGCMANGSPQVAKALAEAMDAAGLEPDVRPLIKPTGCHGFCARGPLVIVKPQNIFYQQVQPDDAQEIVQKTLIEGKAVERLLYVDPVTKKPVEKVEDIGFYKHQTRLALRHIGYVNPADIRDTIIAGGYEALAKALSSMSPEDVLKEVEISGLRGRGGAGFPTGRKWRAALEFSRKSGEKVYVLCNGDEGDPGAFMDRTIMEGDPHAVIEGMILGAYALGAREGYIYVRAEYPVAIHNLTIAMDQARALGLLGENILGTDFSFDIHINRGAGAFVCGEETALMRSIEGKRGMPRPRPPFPAEKGLYDKPTVLNNVETWANVPYIILHGGAHYASIGTEGSKGTKVFALTGQVQNIGLVEVPMGIPLRKIIFDIGGGMTSKRRKFKAVQLGGPSGGCVPEQYLDLPVDYESIVKAGAIMGSGGMIVMDNRSCMVDMARFFMDFVQEESCGKCTPCREGTRRMLEILEKICEGKGTPEDLATLEELGNTIRDSALCGLGQTGPNPVLSTLRYFRDEYEAHIYEKRCPAKVCVELIEFKVDPDKCKSCGLCARNCPVNAIEWEKKKPAVIDREKCIRCKTCIDNCKFDAIY